MNALSSLRASNSEPRYDHSSDEGIEEAKFDLFYKVHNFLVFRLTIYIDNLRSFQNQQANGIVPNGLFITRPGYVMLFDTTPVSIRNLCETLTVVIGSFERFWGGFNGVYTHLHQNCYPLPGQMERLLMKYFLFYKYLMLYCRYITENVMQSSFELFCEWDESRFFLGLLIATMNLLGDLLHMATTPDAQTRATYRIQDRQLWHLTQEAIGLSDVWNTQWLDHRGYYNDDIMHADQASKEGDFRQLDLMGPVLTSQQDLHGIV